MKTEPLFIRFLNGIVTARDIVESFLSSTDHARSREIAEEALSNLPDISVFRKDFRKAVNDLIDNGISKRFVDYVDSYMKPSLLEIVDEGKNQRYSSSRLGEKRSIILKEADTPWVEAIVCYNMSLYIRAYNIQDIKNCLVCGKFFSHKGKYAKYCSDICKANKSK